MNATTPMREDLPDPAAALAEAGISFAREGDAASLVRSFYLRAAGGVCVLLLMPRGLRADFGALARRLGVRRFRLGRRSETLRYGQLPSSLSPFALCYDGEHRLRLAMDEQLLQHEALGFPGKPGTPGIWLRHDALIVFLRALGCPAMIGDWTAR